MNKAGGIANAGVGKGQRRSKKKSRNRGAEFNIL
jgi:hypothetical protein